MIFKYQETLYNQYLSIFFFFLCLYDSLSLVHPTTSIYFHNNFLLYFLFFFCIVLIFLSFFLTFFVFISIYFSLI